MSITAHTIRKKQKNITAIADITMKKAITVLTMKKAIITSMEKGITITTGKDIIMNTAIWQLWKQSLIPQT